MKKLMCTIFFISFACSNEIYYMDGDKKVFLEPIESKTRSLNDMKYYSLDNKEVVGVSKNIIIGFDDNSKIDKILSEYDLEIVKKIDKNVYLLKISSSDNIFQTSNTLDAKKEVLFAHPDFYKQRYKR